MARHARGWPGGGGLYCPSLHNFGKVKINNNILIYRYVQKHVNIDTFCTIHGLIWIPMYKRGFYVRKSSFYVLFLVERELKSLGRAAVGLLFHGMKGKYLVDSFIFANCPRK